MSNAAAQESTHPMIIYLHLSLENRKNCKVNTIYKIKNLLCKKWLPWWFCINHSGQEMKHDKRIFNDDFMHLSLENMKNWKPEKLKKLKISKYMLLCKMVAMVILHQFLSSGHKMSNVETQESNLWWFFCILLKKCRNNRIARKNAILFKISRYLLLGSS